MSSATPFPHTGDVKLDTLHVRLSSVHRSSTVQSNHLSAQEVLPIGDTLRNLGGLIHLIGHDGVCAPFAVVEALFLDLKPSAAYTRVRLSVVTLFRCSMTGPL
jgi:hypothetical protein